jgi:glucose-6-phosphate isomerase
MAWPAYQKLLSSLSDTPSHGVAMADLLENRDRSDRLQFAIDDMKLDLTRQTVTQDQLHILLQLAKEAEVMEKCHAMLDGKIVNTSEQRPALHAHLRDPSQPLAQASVDIMASHLDKLLSLGITDVVSVGIGGSDLGPAMAVSALSPYQQGPEIHFVSTIDPSQMGDCLAMLDPSTTAMLIISKSFNTPETLANMAMAMRWFADADIDYSDRVLAITANPKQAKDMGFGDDNILPFDQGIGGRYSIWSVVGFGLMLAIGRSGFRAMLAGGHAVDEHVLSAPLYQNAPVNLALMRYWNVSVLGRQAESFCPYDQRLDMLTSWLQQLEMESNGKSIDASGNRVDHLTAPIIFGMAGGDAQHSFFQHIHQSAMVTPVTFLAPLRPLMSDANMAADLVADHHDQLILNMLAQADSLALGSADDSGFSGGRPSTIITWLQLSPYTLGRVLALFEYVTTMSGSLWGLNSFDQPGVELGKIKAKSYEAIYQGKATDDHLTDTTKSIFEQLKELKESLTNKP